MDTLRWILLLLGLLIIAGLYGFYRWQERGSPSGGSRRRGRRKAKGRRESVVDPDVDETLRDLDDLVIDEPDDGLDIQVDPPDEDPVRPAEREPGSWDREAALADGILSPPRVRGAGRREPEPTPTPETRDDAPEDGDAPAPEVPEFAARRPPDPDPAPEPAIERQEPMKVRDRREVERPDPVQRDFLAEEDDPGLEEEAVYQDAGEKIIVLHVTAGEGYCFTGPAATDSARQVGLQLDDQGIFQRFPGGDRRRTPLFGMASMVEPGIFDMERVEELETPGLAFFMQLPAPFDGVTAFEEMLETARRLADKLDGHLLDGRRCTLTQQAVEHIREELREYRRRAHLQARRGSARTN